MTGETRQRLRERQRRKVQEPRRRGQKNEQGGQDGERQQLRAVALDEVRRRIERVAVTMMPFAREVGAEMNMRDMLMDRALIDPCMRVVVVMKMVVKRQCRRYE